MCLPEDRQVGASIQPWTGGGGEKEAKEACDFLKHLPLSREGNDAVRKRISQCGKQGEGALKKIQPKDLPRISN